MLSQFKYHSTNDEKYASLGTTDEISWLFPDFDSESQNSLTLNKIPWLWEKLEFPWLFPDRGNSAAEYALYRISQILGGKY